MFAIVKILIQKIEFILNNQSGKRKNKQLNEVGKRLIALSSMKVEYKCVTLATCDIVWLHKILQDLRHDGMKPVTLYCDNMISIQ